MKFIINYLGVTCALLITATIALADSHEMPSIKTSAALNKMKQLVGTWEGSGADMGDGKMEVRYHLTSGGSAVVETLFPGTSQEMTSIYYDQGGQLSMTHYCSLGNHPVMELKKETADQLIFETNVKDLKEEPHMSSLHLTFISSNSIEQKWSMAQPGKEGHSSVFKLRKTS